MFEKLFSPIKIRDMQLPHRIIFPAMGTKFSGKDETYEIPILFSAFDITNELKKKLGLD